MGILGAMPILPRPWGRRLALSLVAVAGLLAPISLASAARSIDLDPVAKAYTAAVSATPEAAAVTSEIVAPRAPRQ